MDVLQTALGVAKTHRVDLVVGNGLLQVCLPHALVGERALELHHAGLQVLDDEITVLDLEFDVLVLLLQLLDDVKVLLRDVVVVLLHFTEGGFMVNHKIVDVLVFALFDFV